jgi:hypothetical protein
MTMGKMLMTITMLVTACGGGDSGPAPDEIAAEIGKVTCAKLADCCTQAEFMEQTLGSDTEQECVALFSGFGGIVFNVIEDSIEAGRVKYHPERMSDCLDVIASASCSEFAGRNDDPVGPSGCEDPFVGQVALGGQCANDVDCVSEYCSGDSVDFNGNVMFGMCANVPSVGQPCVDDECAAGAYCDHSGAAATCVAMKADNSACGSDDECTSGSCNGASGGSDGTCGAPTTCDGM